MGERAEGWGFDAHPGFFLKLLVLGSIHPYAARTYPFTPTAASSFVGGLPD